MANEVLYTRVSTELKEALEAHAAAHGLTLTAASSELLEAGLETTQNAKSVEALTARVSELEQQLAVESMWRQQAEQRYETMQGAAQSWTDRAEQRVGKCRKCGNAIRGADLMVRGACSNCGEPVGPMLVPEKNSGLDERELLLLAGAAGVVLGMLLAGRQ